MPNNEQIVGGGPWTFENETEMSPNEVFKKDFYYEVYNGSKGYFRDYLPLTSIQVVNLSSSSPLIVTINNNGRYHIPPNTSEALDNEQITSFKIENVGQNIIAQGDVKVDVKKDAYNADRKAMDDKLNESSAQWNRLKKAASFIL